jgi:predicted metalloprotease with PDZ domain
MPEAVHYRVSMSRPHSHLFEVEATFPGGSDTVDALMPVWTPGSYLVREFSRHVQDMSARKADGEPLPVQRVDKRTFRVRTGGQAVTLSYRVYANELTVRTSHLDGTHGYFNGATLFLYTEATRGLEHHVTVVAPEGWRAFTALERQGEAFVARDYDELVDSPFEVGPHTPLTFTAAGVPARGGGVGRRACRTRRGCASTSSASARPRRDVRGLPMPRYLFLLYLTDKGRGRLEHKASTSLPLPARGPAQSPGAGRTCSPWPPTSTSTCGTSSG